MTLPNDYDVVVLDDVDGLDELVSAPRFARLRSVSERTVKRWLRDGDIAGARKDEAGRWLIPAGATVRRPADKQLARAASRPADVVPIASSSTALPPLDALPTYLTMEQASVVLGISEHAIRRRAEKFDLDTVGPNGALMMPLATVRRLRG
jgi:hypothetical protein